MRRLLRRQNVSEVKQKQREKEKAAKEKAADKVAEGPQDPNAWPKPWAP